RTIAEAGSAPPPPSPMNTPIRMSPATTPTATAARVNRRRGDGALSGGVSTAAGVEGAVSGAGGGPASAGDASVGASSADSGVEVGGAGVGCGGGAGALQSGRTISGQGPSAGPVHR